MKTCTRTAYFKMHSHVSWLQARVCYQDKSFYEISMTSIWRCTIVRAERNQEIEYDHNDSRQSPVTEW